MGHPIEASRLSKTMTGTIIGALERVRGLFVGPTGLNHSLATIRENYPVPLPAWGELPIEISMAPADLEERSRSTKYPRIALCAERIENGRDERFKRFSGTLRVAADVKVSQDRLDGLTESLYWYVDAVRDVIERHTGCLGDGLVLTGEYDIRVEAAKKGGLYYQQAARVICPVQMSRR